MTVLSGGAAERTFQKGQIPKRAPKCRKPMHFIVLETGGRKFQCVQCDGVDPLRLSDIQALMKGELQPPKLQ
jgi:hypothetical protein